MDPLTNKLTNFSHGVRLVVEEVLSELEKSLVSPGNEGDLGRGGEDGGRVRHGLLQNDVLESGEPGTASVEQGAVHQL